MVPQTPLLELMLAEKQALVWRSPQWFEKLKNAIAHLIAEDFNALIQILYRIDVDEEKLKKALSGLPAADTETIIAQMIVDRKLQSLSSKKQWQPKPTDINDADKWQT